MPGRPDRDGSSAGRPERPAAELACDAARPSLPVLASPGSGARAAGATVAASDPAGPGRAGGLDCDEARQGAINALGRAGRSESRRQVMSWSTRPLAWRGVRRVAVAARELFG